MTDLMRQFQQDYAAAGGFAPPMTDEELRAVMGEKSFEAMMRAREPLFVPVPMYYSVPEFFTTFCSSVPLGPWMFENPEPFTSITIDGRTHEDVDSGAPPLYVPRPRGVVELAGGLP